MFKGKKVQQNLAIIVSTALAHADTLLKPKVVTMKVVIIKRFSIECRETNTKVITLLTNHNRRRQSNEPFRTRSKYMQLAPSAGKRVQTSHDWF